MLIADRLRERMSEFRLSQSELARRVGVTQTTIRKLVSGGGYGSKYLHLIARELQTTPAYLTGEIDDPDEGAPPPPPAPRYQTISLQVLLPDEDALAEMFEGLLEAMDRAAPLDEQARLLARRLPIGLAQLRDLLPAGAMPADAMPRRPQPTPVPAPR